MKLSVIIPTYNRQAVIHIALDSLREQTFPRDDFEIIIIDNSTEEGTKPVVDRYQDLPIKYFRLPHRGVSVARNEGIARASAQILVFFDDDARAKPDWLAQIARIMEREHIITGRVEPLKSKFWNHFAPHYNQGATPCESPVLLEGNCALSRQVFDRIGLFDEELDYGHEGEEFIARARVLYKVMYYPEVVIYHDYASGWRRYLSKQWKFGHKMAYLHRDEIHSLRQLIRGYDTLRRGSTAPAQSRPMVSQPLSVKLIARVGYYVHFLGALAGYRQYCRT